LLVEKGRLFSWEHFYSFWLKKNIFSFSHKNSKWGFDLITFLWLIINFSFDWINPISMKNILWIEIKIIIMNIINEYDKCINSTFSHIMKTCTSFIFNRLLLSTFSIRPPTIVHPFPLYASSSFHGTWKNYNSIPLEARGIVKYKTQYKYNLGRNEFLGSFVIACNEMWWVRGGKL